MEQATASLDEIVDEIVRELGDPLGKSLILPENAVRDEVISFVGRLTAGARKGSREQRMAEADHAQSIDGLLAQLESKLAHPLAPRFNKQLLSAIGRMQEACQRQRLFRPKGGREIDHLKRYCARSTLFLMQKISRRPISGSAETSFPVVTALLHEAVTGERDANCKRACDWVLRHHRGYLGTIRRR
jgi:hypothetical protein